MKRTVLKYCQERRIKICYLSTNVSLHSKGLVFFYFPGKDTFSYKNVKKGVSEYFLRYFFSRFCRKKKNPLIDIRNFLRLFLLQKMRTHTCMGFPIFDLFLRRKIE